MKFSTREDIAAPQDHVFRRASDFAAFERQALRRGADVRRRGGGAYDAGSAWDVAFKFRGRERQLQAELVRCEPPNLLHIATVAGGVDGLTTIEIVPLSPSRTRLAVAIELSARSLSARLFLQSLKLAKATLSARFKKRVAEFAQDVEDSYRP